MTDCCFELFNFRLYRSRREAELSELQRCVEEETRRHEVQLSELRVKHSAALDSLQEQLDNSKRVREQTQTNTKIHAHINMQHHSSCVIHILFQARQSLEKVKATLEEERQNLTSELKSLQASRMETERGRKRADSQLQEVSSRLTQAEREREDREERIHKLQVQQNSKAPILKQSLMIVVNNFLIK